MAFRIRRADYFYATVNDRPEEADKLLSQLAELGINLLAFTAVPAGPMRTQFVYASSGIADGQGSYGYIVYVRHEDFERAAGALDL
jgi:hypothetical protein